MTDQWERDRYSPPLPYGKMEIEASKNCPWRSVIEAEN